MVVFGLGISIFTLRTGRSISKFEFLERVDPPLDWPEVWAALPGDFALYLIVMTFIVAVTAAWMAIRSEGERG